MNTALHNLDICEHVSEAHSPPRVTGLCEGLGLFPGAAFDLSVVDLDDGKPWDFNDPQKRRKALLRMFKTRSLLLIGSPMRSAFSKLHKLNWGRMTPKRFER